MAAELIVALRAQIDQFTGNMTRAGQSVDDFSTRSSKAANFLRQNWAGISAATAGAAVALEALARQQQPLTEGIERLAVSTGNSAQSMRQLAVDTANAGFPLDEVITVMERGREQGLKTGEELKRFANFWDLVGDATGESATELAQAGANLNALGIDANNVGQATAAFGAITRETSQGAGDFLRVIERAAPELQGMGLSIDDTAALLIGMEENLGITGRTARQEFREALDESGGSLDTLLESLGLTSEEFETARQTVADSSDVLAENSQIVDDNITITEKLQSALSETATRWGEQIRVASNFAPALAAIGPIASGASVAMRAAGAAGRLMGIGMTVALGPVGLIVAAIAGAVAAGWFLWQNWDEVVALLNKLWQGFKDFFLPLWENLKTRTIQIATDIFNGVKRWLVDKFTGIVNAIRDKIDAVKGFFGDLFDFTVGGSVIPDMVNRIGEEIARLDGTMVDKVGRQTRDTASAFERLKDAASDIFDALGIDIDSILDKVLGKLNVFGIDVGGLIKSILTDFDGFSRNIVNIVNNVVDTIRKIADVIDDIIGGFADFFRSVAGAGRVAPGTITGPGTQPRTFAEGTHGRFLDFGAGTPAILHGRERIMTEREAVAAPIRLDRLEAEVAGLRRDLRTSLPVMVEQAARFGAQTTGRRR